MELVLSVFVVLVCCFLFFKISDKKENGFPTPPGKFLFGHILDYSNSQAFLEQPKRLFARYGKTVNQHLGHHLYIFSCDHKFIQFTLNISEGANKAEIYNFLKVWLGNGLLVNNGEDWKKNRRILNPAFFLEKLKSYVNVFENSGDTLVRILRKNESKSSVALSSLMSVCALDTICESAMGTKINAQLGKNLDYINSVKGMTMILINRLFSLLKLNNYTFMLTPDYYRQCWYIRTLHKHTYNVIKERKKNFRNVAQSKRLALLDLLLSHSEEDGEGLSDTRIQEEVDTFMFAGHDTTAAAMSFVLWNLSKYPEIQKRVLEEQKDLFGKEKNPKIYYEHLQNMKYLECVIKESLRLFPSVPIVGRLLTQDIVYGDKVLAKGTNLWLDIFNMHRHPDYFENPETFNPERFTDGQDVKAFIPFAVGPRNCIGQKFAMLEMKSIVSKIVRHFELKPAFPKHEPNLIAEIVLKSSNDIKVGMVLRDV